MRVVRQFGWDFLGKGIFDEFRVRNVLTKLDPKRFARNCLPPYLQMLYFRFHRRFTGFNWAYRALTRRVDWAKTGFRADERERGPARNFDWIPPRKVT